MCVFGYLGNVRFKYFVFSWELHNLTVSLEIMPAYKRRSTPMYSGAPYRGAYKSRSRPSARSYSRRTPFRALNRRAVASKETGFVDLATASYVLDTTGSVTLLSSVPQGTSVNERIGKKIQWKSLQFRGNASGGATATFNDCAVLIVYDKP